MNRFLRGMTLFGSLLNTQEAAAGAFAAQSPQSKHMAKPSDEAERIREDVLQRLGGAVRVLSAETAKNDYERNLFMQYLIDARLQGASKVPALFVAEDTLATLGGKMGKIPYIVIGGKLLNALRSVEEADPQWKDRLTKSVLRHELAHYTNGHSDRYIPLRRKELVADQVAAECDPLALKKALEIGYGLLASQAGISSPSVESYHEWEKQQSAGEAPENVLLPMERLGALEKHAGKKPSKACRVR